MRLTIHLLGVEVFHISTDSPSLESDEEDDYSRDLSGGTTGSMPIGFVARMDVPTELDTPDRDW